MLNTKILERIKACNFSEAVFAIDDDVTPYEKHLIKALDHFFGDSLDGVEHPAADDKITGISELASAISLYIQEQYGYEK